MIKEVRIQSRSSGKTTWARDFAEKHNGFYMYGMFKSSEISAKLKTFPKGLTKKVIVIDEFTGLSRETQRDLLRYQNFYDIYLIGTPMAELKTVLIPALFEYITEHFPEAFI